MKSLVKAFIILSILLFSPEMRGLGRLKATAQEGPPVLAFYYAWFDQNTWSSGQSTDLPAEPYNSADRATIARHVAQAQSAGINAFVQSWYGPQEANNQTETNFQTLLEVAAATGFKAAVDIEVSGPFFGDAGVVTNAIATLLATHAQHPAYLRYQGKPVIFFWRQQRFSVDQWVALRNQVDPNRGSFWIAEGTDLSYQAIFDGHHLYSIAWAGSPAGQLEKWGNQVRAYESDHQVDRLWVATSMPGYDDTRLPRDNAFVVPRQNGDYYRQTFRGAMASQPDMIIVNSFNEWPEGTHIEPSANYGNFYLDVTRELVTELHGSPPPAPTSIEVSAQPITVQAEVSTAPQAKTASQAAAQPDEPYISVESITNVRSGPATDFERIGRMAAGETAPVIGQNEAGDWWLIEFEAAAEGQGWVAAEVAEFIGDSGQVPVVKEPTAADEKELPTVEIPAGGVNVRSGPGLDFDLLGRLDEGEVAEIVGKSETGDWWQINYEADEDGLGWITAALVDFSEAEAAIPVVIVSNEDDIFPTPTPTPTALVVVGLVEATDAINVRAEPSVEGTVVGGFYRGETADVVAISEDGAWWQIEYEDGPEGLAWVAVEFVRFQGNQDQVPIFGLGTATPTPGPTDTPTPTSKVDTLATLEFPPTFAPTATSEFDATAAAIVENRGTPDPNLTETSAEGDFSFEWGSLPWGILAIALVVGFFWYQFSRRGRR